MGLLKNIISFLIIISNTYSIYAKEPQIPFIITKVTNHVYIAHPGLVKRINSTSTIIMSESYITVVESQTDVYGHRAY